ncbi:zinc ribbon domain-containing protein [Paenibacillus alkalitolerans]|uniref:zinc ribbon domain-containing protein n=1 Tax=Paenibacillus alkalitolerans TaxID=2799335 RepID=UPI0018F2AA71|nr:zinc ribbon domain-containing protein [Paenibacillus alkalitolerans]
MSLFDKFKQGASEAAKKAQQTVELTRLKTQISVKEKEIEKSYNFIGKAVFEAFSKGDMSQSESEVRAVCQLISQLKQEIKLLDQKIIDVRNEKECVCGTSVSANAKFCPECGNKFDYGTNLED